MFKAVTPMLIPMVHFKMEESENAKIENVHYMAQYNNNMIMPTFYLKIDSISTHLSSC